MAENKPVDMRDALFDRFYEIGSKDPSVVMLAADFDAFGLKKFKDEFPDRFINVGVSEQNMINLASGLALRGKKVFCYSIASFMAARCFEQLKLNLCALNLPVGLIGGGVGLSFGYDGISHHAVQDIALMRTLPEMEIFNCSDLSTAREALDYSVRQKNRPVYIRLDKGPFPNYPLSSAELKQGFRVLHTGETWVAATGNMVSTADSIVQGLRTKGLSVGLIDCFRMTPEFPKELSELLAKGKSIAVVEENCRTGALASWINDGMSDRATKPRMLALTLPDKHFLQYGKREWFHKEYGLDPESLSRAIEKSVRT